MEVYYTKKEYKEMENRLKKQLKTAEAKIERLEAKVKKLQKDYDVLLETSTETVEDNKKVETSLIESFYDPKMGPGQLYESMADIIKEKGGEIDPMTKETYDYYIKERN